MTTATFAALRIPPTGLALLRELTSSPVPYHGIGERPWFTTSGLTALRHRSLAVVTPRTRERPPHVELTALGRAAAEALATDGRK